MAKSHIIAEQTYESFFSRSCTPSRSTRQRSTRHCQLRKADIFLLSCLYYYPACIHRLTSYTLRCSSLEVPFLWICNLQVNYATVLVECQVKIDDLQGKHSVACLFKKNKSCLTPARCFFYRTMTLRVKHRLSVSAWHDINILSVVNRFFACLVRYCQCCLKLKPLCISAL